MIILVCSYLTGWEAVKKSSSHLHESVINPWALLSCSTVSIIQKCIIGTIPYQFFVNFCRFCKAFHFGLVTCDKVDKVHVKSTVNYANGQRIGLC